MKNEEMTHEEKANTDKLEFYYNEKIKVHVILKREVLPGKKAWLNGIVVRPLNNRIWVVDDTKLGEVRLSISEIAPWGVSEFTEVKG